MTDEKPQDGKSLILKALADRSWVALIPALAFYGLEHYQAQNKKINDLELQISVLNTDNVMAGDFSKLNVELVLKLMKELKDAKKEIGKLKKQASELKEQSEDCVERLTEIEEKQED